MTSKESSQDWVSDSRTFALAWGLPGMILIVGIFLDPLLRTAMWAGALLWQGVACLINASRCERTHCYFTGPFFLIVAFVTILHGFQVISLGVNGWMWIGLTIVSGTGFMWLFTEKAWDKFRSAKC